MTCCTPPSTSGCAAPARPSAGSVRVGITHFAQDALGDIVYVSLPQVGDTIDAGSTCGELESTKSVSDVYAPVSGEVVARNRLAGRHTRAGQQRPVRRRLALRGGPERPRPARRAPTAATYQESLGG